MSNHTQVEWKYHRGENYAVVMLPGECTENASILVHFSDELSADKIGKLIAAAPKLLEALETFINRRDTPHGFSDIPWYEPAFEKARAAISAASSERSVVMTSKRTLGPWIAKIDGECSQITDENGDNVTTADYYTGICLSEANATFIVEACNNYDRLLAERDTLVGVLDFTANALTSWDGGSPTKYLDCQNSYVELQNEVKRFCEALSINAKAAIALIGKDKT